MASIRIADADTRPASAVVDARRMCAAEILDVIPAIMRQIRSQMRQASSVELTVPQFRTLRFLNVHPGCSLSSVADHIGLSLASMSKMVQLLINRGYVTRQTDHADRRRSMLTPTHKGQRVLKTSRQAACDAVADSLLSMSGDRQRLVFKSMRLLREIYLPELNGAAGETVKAPDPIHKRKLRAKAL